jgi:hypothetical protein
VWLVGADGRGKRIAGVALVEYGIGDLLYDWPRRKPIQVRRLPYAWIENVPGQCDAKSSASPAGVNRQKSASE